jgi:outer membrane protein assembly factor BamA
LICALLWVSPLLAQRVRIDSILVEGVKRTHPLVVTRQMVFQVGDTVELSELDALNKTNKSNIYNLGLFTSVELANELGEGRVNVHVAVQERWYIFPTPYVALLERTFNEWWLDKDLDRLVYGLGLEWQNISGWNDRAYIYAQNGYRQELSTLYSRPFLFPKSKIDGTASFYFINDKEVGYSTRGGYLQLARLHDHRMRQNYTAQIVLGKRLSARKMIHATFAYQNIRLHDSILAFNPKYLPANGTRAVYPSVGLSLVNDQRDIRSFPLAGYKYGASIRSYGIPGISTAQFAKVALSFSHHIPLSKRWNFAYGSQQFLLLGNRIPYFDKYFIGFGSFLRGYEPFVIDGSFINVTKAEWKFGILPYHFAHWKWIPFQKFRDFPVGLYLSAYTDAGYVHDWTFNNQDNTLKNKLLLGYGAGVNFVTIYDFLLRVEYSRNRLGSGGIYISTLVSIQ